jgi:glycosyltransferase involved in cell wall biosynthesis
MKILIVSTTFSKDEGGATGIAYQQALAMKKLGHEVFVFAGTRENDLGWQDKNRVKIYKVENKSCRYITRSYLCLFNFRVQKEFKKILKEVNPEIIHFHNLYFQLPFSLIKIAKKSSRKVFFTSHDVMTFSQQKLTFFVGKKWNLKNIDQVNYKLPLVVQIRQDRKAFNPFRNVCIRYYLRFCDKIFSVSSELKKALNQNGIKNVEVVHNGIDVNNWVSEIEEVNKIKNNFGLNNKKVILFAGRLSGAKGGKIIIDAMSVLTKDSPDIVLLVLGEKNEFVKKIQNSLINMPKRYITLINKKPLIKTDNSEYKIVKKQENCWTVKLAGKKSSGIFKLNFTVE